MSFTARRRIFFAVGLAGAVLSVLSVISAWLGVAGGVLAAAVLILQYRQGPSAVVTISFLAADWHGTSPNLVLRIPPESHGRRSPTAETYRDIGGGRMQWIGTDVSHEEDGTLVIGASRAFDGEARVT